MKGNANEESGIGRRKLLQSAGVGALAASGLPTVTRGEPTFQSKIKRSLEVKRRTNDVDAWVEHLRDRGIGVARDQHTFEVPAHGSDGVSTSNFSDPQYLDITLTLSVDCYGSTAGELYYADLSWGWESVIGGYGEDPLDFAGIGYDSDWWDLWSYTLSKTTETSDYVSVDESYGFDGTGPAFKVDDVWADDPDDLYWGGVYLTPINDNLYDSSERRLQGGYGHTWTTMVRDVSVGFSVPPAAGVTIDVEDETHDWETKTEKDGDTLLRVKQNGAVCGDL